MTIAEFLKTIYVGDRACKSIFIDGWNSEVKVQVDCISRVRSKTWQFYADEDLEDGFIVFEGVSSVEFSPSGPVPNDLINDIRIETEECDDEKQRLVLQIDSVDPEGRRVEVFVRVVATSVALEARDKSGERIRD